MRPWPSSTPPWTSAGSSMSPAISRIPLDPAARFIGTMNYGYAGTRELNEALVSRFVVLDMPVISQENLQNSCARASQS